MERSLMPLFMLLLPACVSFPHYSVQWSIHLLYTCILSKKCRLNLNPVLMCFCLYIIQLVKKKSIKCPLLPSAVTVLIISETCNNNILENFLPSWRLPPLISLSLTHILSVIFFPPPSSPSLSVLPRGLWHSSHGHYSIWLYDMTKVLYPDVSFHILIKRKVSW